MSLVVAHFCLSRPPVEKLNHVGVGLVGDGDSCACTPFNVAQGEEVAADLEPVLDCWDLSVVDRVLDLVEALFGEYGLVPERMLRIFSATVQGRQESITKAPVVGVVDIDDCLLRR